MERGEELYPELVEHGGLAGALEAALRAAGSSLEVTTHGFARGPAYARVESGARASQMNIAAEDRSFTFDFWSRGVMLARGQTEDLVQASAAIQRWVSDEVGTRQL